MDKSLLKPVSFRTLVFLFQSNIPQSQIAGPPVYKSFLSAVENRRSLYQQINKDGCQFPNFRNKLLRGRHPYRHYKPLRFKIMNSLKTASSSLSTLNTRLVSDCVAISLQIKMCRSRATRLKLGNN